MLVVDKPEGPTSHDIVAQARRRFSTRRVGHAGTLDPMATGVLVLLFGEATKLSAHLSAELKSYRARVSLGVATDSHDAQGATTQQRPLEPDELTEARLRQALAEEAARREQVPPSVSAIKVGGRRAHALQRAGQAPQLAPRAVCVHRLRLESFQGASVELSMTVSKGYYVRSLARDLGERLAIPAHLSALRRSRSGGLDLAQAAPWPPPEDTRPIALASAIRRLLPCASLTAEGVDRARKGQSLELRHFASWPADAGEGQVTAWLAEAGYPVALGCASQGSFRLHRGFLECLAEQDI